jgi:hypothetical protein
MSFYVKILQPLQPMPYPRKISKMPNHFICILKPMQRAKSFHCILKLMQRKEMKKKCQIIYLHIKTNAKFENQCKEKKSD